jgi:p-hydroxybenzoate 3-monooxygenase
MSYKTKDGERREVTCDVIAGCDGFHGITRGLVPGLKTYERAYPYAWLAITADVPPSTDELIYSRHPDGFALHTMRSLHTSRLYLQVPVETDSKDWPDDRIWTELSKRLALPGWTLETGPVVDKSVTPMRSFVAAPMRHGRLFLAGDAAHIVPPTGAKGLNLALADVRLLTEALDALLTDRDSRLADEYSDTALRRVWRATHFSWWMTSMLHVDSGAGPFDERLQLSQLDYVISSRAAATTLAENYTGYRF